MTPEHVVALLQLIAELRIQIGQMPAENAQLSEQLSAFQAPSA